MNGSEYLEQAYKIYNGESPSWLWRGPMYSILLAISFFIGGVTVQSAHWMTELIFLFSVCSFYYLGKIIYGSKISFLASLLIILSFKIFAIRRDISLEFLYTGFIFLSCAIFFRAYKSNRKSFFVFSGLLLGLGILTKEISLFYLPFPILVTLLFINGRSKDVLKGVILHYLSILLILLPWVVFLYSQNETVTALLGGMRPEWSNAQSTIGYLNIITLISDLLFKGSIGTYNSLNKLFWLTPALIISTLFIFIFGFIRNNKNDKMFISVFVLFIPWTLSYGLWDDGLRHIVLSIMLFHLAFARIIFLILILINRLISHEIRLFSSKKTNLLLTLLVTSIFIIPIISFNQNSKKTFSSIIKNYKNSKYAIRFGTDITLGGRFSKEITDSAIWIKNNIPKGSVIRTGGMFHFPIKFYTNFNYQYRYIRGDITNVPKYYFLPDLISNPSSMTNSNSKQYSEFVFDAIQSLHRQEDRIVCITTTKKFRSHHFRYRKQIILILESDLKLFLEEITSKKQWIMRFDSQKVFFPLVDDILNNISNIVYNKNGVKIYETVPEKYNQYDFTRFDRLHISPWTTDDFSWLNKHYNNEYLKIDKFLSENNIHLNL
tara:strand:+ start:9226 stop:11037 length:1812 start_codon:yes stop_codon:yes gene_type:complete